MGSRGRRAACAGTAILLLLVGDRVLADMPPLTPPNLRPVRQTVRVDFGPLAPRIGRPHVVVAGDTLHRIAQGASYRPGWKTLAAVNAAVVPDPQRMRVGTTLWIPGADVAVAPASGASGATAGYAALLVYPSRAGFETTRLAPGPGLTVGLPLPSALAIVPVQGAPDALRWKDGLQAPRGTTVGLPGVASAALDGGPGFVPSMDPTIHRELVVRVRGIDGARLLVESEVLAYDAAGRVLTAPASASPLPLPPPVPAGPRPSPDEEAGIPVARTRGGAADLAPVSASPGEEDPARWPTTIGLLVAGIGLAVVALLWALKSPAAPRP